MELINILKTQFKQLKYFIIIFVFKVYKHKHTNYKP